MAFLKKRMPVLAAVCVFAPAAMGESRFGDYRQLAIGFVAALVEFFVEDKRVFSEEYSEIVANPKLDPAAFDPKQFTFQHWEK